MSRRTRIPPDSDQKMAAALSYKQGFYAPVVVAKGKGVMAEAIIACAREAGIYVHESADLVTLLMQVDLDEHIPPELYRAVAEILVWLYKMEAQK
ncbi:MAG: EscU/YscU/HrcU family type III secretion system export apparatus switch protein [Trichlorobacter sp.]|nr:EscU/YscU/HrcU family type III secretion system export apparatus switch protein [Trichlorobacter sp.]